MKFRQTFFSSLLIGLLLLSGQVFAVTYYSVPGPGLWLATGTWNNVACGSTAGGGQVPTKWDTLIICNGSAVSVGAVSVGLNATVEVGGALNLSTHVLTLSGALTNNGGTINGVGAQAFVAQSIVHNAGITNLMGVTTDSAATITVNATGLTLPTILNNIIGLFTSDVNFTMPGSVTTMGNIAVTGGNLILNINNVGSVVVNTRASISGTYSGTPTASASVPPTIPPLSCPSGTHLIGSPGSYTCDTTPIIIPIGISAPIFLIKEKARVFIEEVI